MPYYAHILTTLFAVGSIALLILIGGVLLYRFMFGVWIPEQWKLHVRAYGLRYASVLPVFSFFLSLWYSDVLGFAPCALCWFARTAMYPLALILLIAVWRKDNEVWVYALPLASIGVLVTGYNHLLQMGIVSLGVCGISQGVSCATRYVFEFGFVTLPLFGFVAFLATALILWIIRDVR